MGLEVEVRSGLKVRAGGGEVLGVGIGVRQFEVLLKALRTTDSTILLLSFYSEWPLRRSVGFVGPLGTPQKSGQIQKK